MPIVVATRGDATCLRLRFESSLVSRPLVAGAALGAGKTAETSAVGRIAETVTAGATPDAPPRDPSGTVLDLVPSTPTTSKATTDAVTTHPARTKVRFRRGALALG